MSNNKKKTNKKTSKKTNKKDLVTLIIAIALIVGLVVLIALACTGAFESKEITPVAPENSLSEDITATSQTASEGDVTQMPEENVKTYEEIPEGHPVVTVEMEDGQKFKMELYPEYAPQTVANFVALAESGFYNGLSFHRVVEGFMAQGGDPNGDGTGGNAETIVGEFSSNDFAQNTLSHTRGVVSMARSQANNSASSQFFVCYDDASFLDGQYAAFGKVIEGMEVVDGFLKVERTMNAMGEEATPVKPIIMKTVTVER